MTRTALYRHFDAAGQLLYVGISLNSIQRTAAHRSKDWFELIARIEIIWLPTRAHALAAEAIAIARENPLWNVSRPSEDQWPGLRPLGVLHLRSQRIDGWYSRDAAQMLGWFQAVYPGEQFALIVAPPQGSADAAAKGLKTGDWKAWSSVAPDLAAGVEFDRRFE
jgi:excinuclease UvrABC nuclease subunit